MFDLIVNETSLYLPEDFEMEIIRESPLFNDRGDFSYPFTVPYEPNKATFGYCGEIEAVIVPGASFDWRIEWNEEILLSGTIPSWTKSGDDIELNLIGGKTLFYSRIKNIFLDEKDLGEITDTDKDKLHASLGYDSSVLDFVCAPIYCPSYEQEEIEGVINPLPILNTYDPIGQKLVGVFGDDYDGYFDKMAMHAYLVNLLKKLIKYTGYTVGRNDLDDYPDFAKAYIINLNVFAQYRVWNYRNLMPHILITDFLDQLNDWIGLQLISNDLTKTIDICLLTKIISNTEIDTSLNNTSLEDEDEVLESFEVEKIKLTYSLSNSFEYSREDYEYHGYNDHYLAIVPSALHNLFTYEIAGTNKAFQCIKDPDVEENYILVNIGEMNDFSISTITEDHTEKEIDIIPLESAILDVDILVNAEEGVEPCEIPSTDEDLNESLDHTTNGYPVMIAFYQGLISKDGYNNSLDQNITAKYPLSTYDNYDILHETKRNDICLRLTSDSGIGKIFHQKVLEWQENRKRAIEKYFEMSPSELFSIDFKKKYQFDDYPFLIDKVNITLGRDKIKEIRIELFTT